MLSATIHQIMAQGSTDTSRLVVSCISPHLGPAVAQPEPRPSGVAWKGDRPRPKLGALLSVMCLCLLLFCSLHPSSIDGAKTHHEPLVVAAAQRTLQSASAHTGEAGKDCSSSCSACLSFSMAVEIGTILFWAARRDFYLHIFVRDTRATSRM